MSKALDRCFLKPRVGRKFQSSHSSVFLSIVLLTQLWLMLACKTSAESKGSLTKEAAESCDLKIQKLEDFAAGEGTGNAQATRISENEINSYLAFRLSQAYHPSLKSVLIKIEESKLRAIAIVDFDQLGFNSRNVVTRLLQNLLTGVHELSLQGTLIADEGKAHLLLEEATFDKRNLPKVLVEEIVSAVGLRQDPPFDPLSPSDMPYKIRRVEPHSGYIVVFQ